MREFNIKRIQGGRVRWYANYSLTPCNWKWCPLSWAPRQAGATAIPMSHIDDLIDSIRGNDARSEFTAVPIQVTKPQLVNQTKESRPVKVGSVWHSLRA